MSPDDWLDMHRYPNLDPDLAVEPAQLARLHDALHTAPAAPLSDDVWNSVLHGGADPFPPEHGPIDATDPALADPSSPSVHPADPSHPWDQHLWDPHGHHTAAWTNDHLAPDGSSGPGHNGHLGHSGLDGHDPSQP